jgi:hypothetical protein
MLADIDEVDDSVIDKKIEEQSKKYYRCKLFLGSF